MQIIPNFDQVVDDQKRSLTPAEVNKKIVDFWVNAFAEISINESGSEVVADILREIGRTPLINIKKGFSHIYDLIAQKPEKYDTFVTLMMRAKLLDNRISGNLLVDIYCSGMTGLINHKNFESFTPGKGANEYSFMDLFLLVLKVNLETVTIALPAALSDGSGATIRALDDLVRNASKKTSRR